MQPKRGVAVALHVFAELKNGELHVVYLSDDERARVEAAVRREVGVLRLEEKPIEMMYVERRDDGDAEAN